MQLPKIISALVMLLLALPSTADEPMVNRQEMHSDMQIVWPLVQTVAVEYQLAMAQLAFCNTDDEREAFMCEYEKFVKENYFKKVIALNLRQGKLLLLLIDREIGKTPFELLKEHRSYWRAMFWHRFARILGASLKEEYIPEKYPYIEDEVLKLQQTMVQIK